jgi:cytidine deaminase
MDSAILSKEHRAKLLKTARNVLPNAYAPFSGFRVGAAVLTEAGKFYKGVNVENSSYGLTMCAERSAIFSAVAAEGAKVKIKALAVVCALGTECSPCGACRQVIAELGPEARVLTEGPAGLSDMSILELLPKAFRLS